MDPSGYKGININQLKNESWLFKIVSRYNPGFILDKSFNILRFKKLGISLALSIIISYNTNNLGLVSISKSSLKASFLGISIGVGWGSVSMSYSTKINNHSIALIQQYDWIKATKAMSIMYSSKSGLKVALVMSFSINHLTKLAAKALVAGAILVFPAVAPFMGNIIAASSFAGAGTLYSGFQRVFA